MAYRLSGFDYELDTSDLPPGDYALSVMAADGVHVTESRRVPLQVRPGG